MEMRFFWVADEVFEGKFNIKYYPGKEYLADYQSKHHLGAHQMAALIPTRTYFCLFPPKS
jgi:hypothetical protein